VPSVFPCLHCVVFERREKVISLKPSDTDFWHEVTLCPCTPPVNVFGNMHMFLFSFCETLNLTLKYWIPSVCNKYQSHFFMQLCFPVSSEANTVPWGPSFKFPFLHLYELKAITRYSIIIIFHQRPFQNHILRDTIIWFGGSQCVPRGSYGNRDPFPGYMWIRFYNGYFEAWCFAKNNRGTSFIGSAYFVLPFEYLIKKPHVVPTHEGSEISHYDQIMQCIITCATGIRGEFRPRQTRQLPRAVDLKGRLLSCQSY